MQVFNRQNVAQTGAAPRLHQGAFHAFLNNAGTFIWGLVIALASYAALNGTPGISLSGTKEWIGPLDDAAFLEEITQTSASTDIYSMISRAFTEVPLHFETLHNAMVSKTESLDDHTRTIVFFTGIIAIVGSTLLLIKRQNLVANNAQLKWAFDGTRRRVVSNSDWETFSLD